MGPLQAIAQGKRILLAAAAPAEARAAWSALGHGPDLPEIEWKLIPCRLPFDIVLTGVGKASAAGAIARSASGAAHAAVISIGVAGALPSHKIAVGDVVLADRCAFADEGVQTEDGWTDIAARGFPPGPWEGISIATHPALLRALRPLADHVGTIATVSTCSGADSLAAECARRTGAIAEAMEGAAIAATCARIGLPFAELRVISNHCGSAPAWDLPGALARLAEVLGRLA
jgi:futalosine hydrolase